MFTRLRAYYREPVSLLKRKLKHIPPSKVVNWEMFYTYESTIDSETLRDESWTAQRSTSSKDTACKIYQNLRLNLQLQQTTNRHLATLFIKIKSSSEQPAFWCTLFDVYNRPGNKRVKRRWPNVSINIQTQINTQILTETKTISANASLKRFTYKQFQNFTKISDVSITIFAHMGIYICVMLLTHYDVH